MPKTALWWPVLSTIAVPELYYDAAFRMRGQVFRAFSSPYNLTLDEVKDTLKLDTKPGSHYDIRDYLKGFFA